MKVVEYLQDGVSFFEKCFNSLDAQVSVKVVTALYRLEQGNLSNVKSVGKGVSEYRIDFGPGYRIYFGQDGNTLIVLLCGGSKKTQSKDIIKAQLIWVRYKTEKRRKIRG
ncbi:MAG: type II toxin-antitoxin system RelE/ParE family toxin [Nitrospira sp.]|nr:type II toxin-antitoxin system RelE/ParE family toxin [Nitrospira sp.]